MSRKKLKGRAATRKLVLEALAREALARPKPRKIGLLAALLMVVGMVGVVVIVITAVVLIITTAGCVGEPVPYRLFSDGGPDDGAVADASDPGPDGGVDTEDDTDVDASVDTESETDTESDTEPEDTCAHSVCDEGPALIDGCNACVIAICDYDGYCCAIAWDGGCVAHTTTFCADCCADQQRRAE